MSRKDRSLVFNTFKGTPYSVRWGMMFSRVVALVVMMAGIVAVARAQGSLDFPGPVLVDLESSTTSITQVAGLPNSARYLVAGTEDGFLVLSEFRPEVGKVGVLGRYFSGGIPVALMPDLQATEGGLLVAAFADPDRLVFFEIQILFPYFREIQSIALEEDPGKICAVARGSGGDPGLVVSLPGMDSLVILGRVQGEWKIFQELPTGDGPTGLATGDLDGDGLDEIYVSQVGFLSANISIFKQDSAGIFHRETEYDPGFTPGPIVVLDVDDDGADELVVSSGDQPVVSVLNLVAGSYVERDRIALTVPVTSLHLAPLADGSVGMFAANSNRGLVDYVDFREGLWTLRQPYYPGCLPLDCLPHDFTGDGWCDLISVGDPSGFTIMYGKDGPEYWGFHALPLLGAPSGLALGDIDGDGILDAVTIFNSIPELRTFSGMPTGGLSSSGQDELLDFIPKQVVILEPGLPGAAPVAASDLQGSRVVVMDLSVPDEMRILDTLDVDGGPAFIRSADIDGDGHGDLVVLQDQGQNATIFYGDGVGHFPDQFSMGIPFLASDFETLDLNGDGFLDLAFGGVVHRIGSMLNQDGRSFGSIQWAPISMSSDQFAAGDLDGDLDRDLVVLNHGDQSLTMLENDGSGNLVIRIEGFSLPSSPEGMAMGDVNSDGRPEVLVNLRGAGQLGVVLVGDHWEYGVTLAYPSSGDVTLLASGDFNLDNKVDVLALEGTLNLGLIMLNDHRNLVGVESRALEFRCSPEGERILVTPDRPGFWELTGHIGDRWIALASPGWAMTGVITYDRGTWFWDPGMDLNDMMIGSEAGSPLQLRLTVGGGAEEEFLDSVWEDPCEKENLPTGQHRMSWAERPWPNPFNPALSLAVRLAKPAEVDVCIFDLRGRKMAELFHGSAPAGVLDLTWDGMTRRGPAPSGLYFIRAKTESDQLVTKVLLAR